MLIWEDKHPGYGEDWLRAIGESAREALHVAFTWRGGTFVVEFIG